MAGGSFNPKVDGQPLGGGTVGKAHAKGHGGAMVAKMAAEGSCETSLGELPEVPQFSMTVENGACHGSICGWDLGLCILIDDADFPAEDDVAKVLVCG